MIKIRSWSHVLPVVTALALVGSFLLGSLACSSTHSDGTSLAVEIQQSAAVLSPIDGGILSDGGIDGGGGFSTGFSTTNDLGYLVSVSEFHVAMKAVELRLCPQSASYENKVRSFFELKSAYAHTSSSPTQLGVPVVWNVIQNVNPVLPVGSLQPPGGSYCAAVVTFGAADSDAIGLQEAPWMRAKTLVVKGSYARAGNVARAFEVTASFSSDVQKGVTLDLSLPQSRVLSIGVPPARLFDGVEFETVTLDALHAKVLANVGTQLVVGVR